MYVLRFSEFTKPDIALWFIQRLYVTHFVVLEYYSVKRISMDYELDFAHKSIHVFVLHSGDVTLSVGVKEFDSKPS